VAVDCQLFTGSKFLIFFEMACLVLAEGEIEMMMKKLFEFVTWQGKYVLSNW